PHLMRVGSLWVKSLRPPSGYSITSTVPFRPWTCVYMPISPSASTLSSKRVAEKRVSRLTVSGIGKALGSGVVDREMAVLLAFDHEIALEAFQELLVERDLVELGVRIGVVGRVVDGGRVRRRRGLRRGLGGRGLARDRDGLGGERGDPRDAR